MERLFGTPRIHFSYPRAAWERRCNAIRVNEKEMHIHALRLSVTEQELNELVTDISVGKNPVQNLRVRLTSEGIVVLGEYPTMLMRMAFETLWEVKGIGCIVEARLASVKVSGLPAGMLRAVLLKTLRDLL